MKLEVRSCFYEIYTQAHKENISRALRFFLYALCEKPATQFNFRKETQTIIGKQLSPPDTSGHLIFLTQNHKQQTPNNFSLNPQP